MASIQRRGNVFQVRVKSKLLPRPFFITFDTEPEAITFRDRIDAMLARGIVPVEMLQAPPKAEDDPLLIEVVRLYTQHAPITDSDNELLDVVMEEIAGVRLSGLSFLWVEGWVRRLKVEANLAPGTIRKRVGALARVIDWHFNRSTPKDKTPPGNPLRLMSRGYSRYSSQDIRLLSIKDKRMLPKVDRQRDRRLHPDEEELIRAALRGEKRPDRERPLPGDPHLELLFDLILHTGLRLYEAFRLTVDRIDLKRRIVNVDGSKGHRGIIKPRTVPVVAELKERLVPFTKAKPNERLFPYWDGDPATRRAAGNRLSKRFTTLFDYAGVPDFTEHDLRHEATCRWVLMRDSTGHWMFSDMEICRIMGWSNTAMLLRYSSLRGEDLSNRLL